MISKKMNVLAIREFHRKSFPSIVKDWTMYFLHRWVNVRDIDAPLASFTFNRYGRPRKRHVFYNTAFGRRAHRGAQAADAYSIRGIIFTVSRKRNFSKERRNDSANTGERPRRPRQRKARVLITFQTGEARRVLGGFFTCERHNATRRAAPRRDNRIAQETCNAQGCGVTLFPSLFPVKGNNRAPCTISAITELPTFRDTTNSASGWWREIFTAARLCERNRRVVGIFMATGRDNCFEIRVKRNRHGIDDDNESVSRSLGWIEIFFPKNRPVCVLSRTWVSKAETSRYLELRLKLVIVRRV